MGWWWDKDPQKPVSSPSDSIPDPTPTPSEPPASARELSDRPVPLPSSDQDVERELEKYLGSAVNANTKPKFESVSRRARESLGLPARSSTEPEDDSATETAATISGEETSAFPETMSCRDAFDRAFYCNSLGGQIQNVYRYGSTRDCKPNWNEFWFCMKVRSQSDDSRRRKIKEWYIRKEAESKLGSSSEDIWEVRKEPLERAFDRNPDVA